MDENLTEKIRSLLSDPQAAERIASIAGMLGAGNPSGASDAQPASAQQGPPQPPPPSQAPPYRHDTRVDLLRALRPFASEEKRSRIDDLIRIATVASLLGGLKN